MCTLLLQICLLGTYLHVSKQDCLEEISNNNSVSVIWHQTPPATNVQSNPLCYYNEELVTRNCTETNWIPPIEKLQTCSKVVEYFDESACPPGLHKFSQTDNENCYKIHEPSTWNYPCFKSGGASLITDLDAEQFEFLLQSLHAMHTSKRFWLPAQRVKSFHPIVWYIPGSYWGHSVNFSSNVPIRPQINNNCLLLDIERKLISTEKCNKEYPSLCFYINDLHYPAKCPDGYHAFRFMPNDGMCFGIEKTENGTGFTLSDFLKTQCNKPMGRAENGELQKFIFMKIAEQSELSRNSWCWFGSNEYTINYSYNNGTSIFETSVKPFESVINKQGTLSLMSSEAMLSCMACEKEIIYKGMNTEFEIEYNNNDRKIYLTVYFPSGLWKDENDDIGIQCFSDAKGFVKVISVDEYPIIDVDLQKSDYSESVNVEKSVYVIDLVTDMPAQYWCEGHTQNFSLITTEKIIVNPRGNQIHVFSLTIKICFYANENTTLSDILKATENVTTIFETEKILLMDVSEPDLNEVKLVMHLHVTVNDSSADNGKNLQDTYIFLKTLCENELPKHNITFVSLSSSLYCLPTTSIDFIVLDWELTPVGHITAPKQFCLQTNGLPVKRRCYGSYLHGSVWGQVEGTCDKNYEPSEKTTFLYNFAKGQVSENATSRFLIDGLNFVLDDTDIIIPADIYYLAMSLKHILNIAHENQNSIEMGDIENIAWVMDRVMDLDIGYLHLAQTLNSTNVILDSVNNIIDILVQTNVSSNKHDRSSEHRGYQIAIKPQFVIQISYPKYNNITGIALVRSGHSDKFTDMIVYPLYKNTTLDHVFSIENLEIASWLPENILNNLKCNSNITNSTDLDNFHIVISIYHNDAMFQELNANKSTVISRIIEISVPNFISNLEYSVPLIFNQINITNFSRFCGYWDFESHKINSIPGHWSNRGCYLIKTVGNLGVCECYHLTHFGQLINIQDVYSNDKNEVDHTKVLNIITLTGSFLSLLGIIGIWITALVFDVWRKKAGTKVLIQLSTSIALPLILMLVFNLNQKIFVESEGKFILNNDMKIVCITLGALLHYSILANFVWMLITATLQFIRYVRVLGVSRPSRFMIKFMIIGWGTPIVPVVSILWVNHENYIPDPSINRPICYPKEFYFIASVIIPISIILVINIILFLLVIKSISQSSDMRTTDRSLVFAQLRLSIFLFFLLGLTWIFGIISFTGNFLWSYLFCLTATVQGFVLFIYFVICDPSTRNLWVMVFKPPFSRTSSRKSIMSINSE
ncbi:uncharacterized protein LOC113518543 [Galleria mellonella]|uniref:Uncharacterized protein LOC113518543 n=1 Tax=Galleria mellonella TaxID=7137 RepID=A0A6J1WTU9_GALME|nr:uncharacterized protein LOC113518543 [Galleria mellonella]